MALLDWMTPSLPYDTITTNTTSPYIGNWTIDTLTLPAQAVNIVECRTHTNSDVNTMKNRKNKNGNTIPKVKRIIFNKPATIVLWEDGTKTVVKCMEGETFNEYYGFLCALGKKIFGNNSKLTKLVRSFSEEKKDA